MKAKKLKKSTAKPLLSLLSNYCFPETSFVEQNEPSFYVQSFQTQ